MCVSTKRYLVRIWPVVCAVISCSNIYLFLLLSLLLLLFSLFCSRCRIIFHSIMRQNAAQPILCSFEIFMILSHFGQKHCKIRRQDLFYHEIKHTQKNETEIQNFDKKPRKMVSWYIWLVLLLNQLQKINVSISNRRFMHDFHFFSLAIRKKASR